MEVIMTTFEISAGGSAVPAGNYKARFLGVEPSHHEEYGDGLLWRFEVISGEFANQQPTRITTDKPTLKNAAGRMIGQLTGANLTAGAKIDIGSAVGKEFLIRVEATPSGSTRVDSVFPLDQ
jgi:hypothetical protein